MLKYLLTVALTFSVVAPASAKEIKFKILNKSKFAINEIYASLPGDDGSWGEDMFDEDTVLKTGETANATITTDNNQCNFDLKFVFEDDGDKDETNNSVIEKNINLCETSTYTLEDE